MTKGRVFAANGKAEKEKTKKDSETDTHIIYRVAKLIDLFIYSLFKVNKKKHTIKYFLE